MPSKCNDPTNNRCAFRPAIIAEMTGTYFLISPLINSIAGRPMQDDEMQGAQILRNEAYNQYAPMTKDEAERSRSRFSTACQIDSSQTEGTP